ncbi:PREDICTED: uncharacterized protein LOC106748184 isoform X5 [Dinoponera quadriceps]|uniref:Uncharacterized protein LOC106748184 isoform X5 n=1 Tax=Dinoponera quadriceps TaxID=609295 RepID=A0A6P3XVJ1_DINQU|nr:PREDICTED: uncharacterized protein LOC106748184 isoform X5 [Dinoponera quadriceps]
MADTSQQQALSEPHTNGAVDGLTEEEKSKMRPADIDADMREMERRKRVEMMMNSRIFREELERIIETQMKDGAGPSGLLQQISDMMGAQGARFNGNVFKNSNCVLPINDIRGVESMGYAKGEKLLRCKLAAVFRLLDLYGWTQGVGGQITARLNQDQEHFLVNPYGLLYHEVTASSLIKVDMQGAVVEQGTTNFGVHVTGFQLHSTIHAARPDIKCIIHITTPSVTAISSLKCGLLPIGQESIVIGEVSSHQYIGGSVEPEEREKIARNLGPINKVMLLTNRGALCCGETVEEAFFNVYNTVVACETQLKLMPAGVDNLNLISEESKKAIFEASRKPPSPQQQSTAVESSALAEKLEKRWRIGGAEFEALMRMLDNAGFRTGYIYRNPLVKGEPPRPRNDVEVPPAVSSLGYLLEEEELYKQGLWKGGRKGTDRSRWLNSPNVYQKVEILETGTPDPKKITKWVSDGSPTHSSTPVKIDSALQFVPKNTNPKEFKQIQQQIKDYRRADKISAGPQSHILEGVSWEEAKKMQDATISGTGEQVVLVGAASKGIIQRGFQHNAMVYKTPYAKNPFDAVTDQELDQYKREVERKQKGDPYDESQSESEALSSFNISRATHESSTAKSPIQSPVSVTSETEEESRDEPRVLRIETKQVPAPSQPEVVLSDVNDATTEFLNEMRSREITERQSDYKGDCELSSSYSSTSSERVRMYRNDRRFSESLYSPPRLEKARITTTAERKKPVLITRSRMLADDRSAESFGEIFNSRYEARRRFFQDLEQQPGRRANSDGGEQNSTAREIAKVDRRTTNAVLDVTNPAEVEGKSAASCRNGQIDESFPKEVVSAGCNVPTDSTLDANKEGATTCEEATLKCEEISLSGPPTEKRATEDKGTSQDIRSWIESHSAGELAARTGTPESYYEDLTRMVESMDANKTSSRTELDALPNTDTCLKYNLDSTNMSLIYSLTPSMAVDDDDTSQDLAAERSSDGSDYIWMESTTGGSAEAVKSSLVDCPYETSGSSDCEQPLSASSGSDILELPSRTVFELNDIDGEVFHSGINESTNEIIAELNASSPDDSVRVARCILAEVVECVCVLSRFDASICELAVVRELVRHLLDNDACRMKDFPTENRAESSAVIEFCTVARRLPLVVADDGTLRLNFRVVGAEWPGRRPKENAHSESPSRLTPINEEPDDDYSFNDDSRLVVRIDDSARRNRIVSLDDTYTISEYSDNDDSSVDCAFCPHDIKEFVRLEKAVAENSRFNAA